MDSPEIHFIQDLASLANDAEEYGNLLVSEKACICTNQWLK